MYVHHINKEDQEARSMEFRVLCHQAPSLSLPFHSCTICTVIVKTPPALKVIYIRLLNRQPPSFNSCILFSCCS